MNIWEKMKIIISKHHQIFKNHHHTCWHLCTRVVSSPSHPQVIIWLVNLDNVFLFNETPSTILESQDKTAKEIIIKGLDNFFPIFVKLLSSEKWFGSFVHVEPISATKEYFVFDLPKYFKHLLLVNQIQVGTDSSIRKYNYLIKSLNWNIRIYSNSIPIG